MTKTKIEWADEVWNPVTGCSKVSQGCKNCYAETIAQRFWGERKFTDVRLHPERLDEPLRWKKPRRVFVNSMSDLFHEDVPDEFIQRVFEIMYQARQHTFLILTKRAERMLEEIRVVSVAGTIRYPLKNLWLGVSVENQVAANVRVPLLLLTPAAVRFVSVEPLLGAINLSQWLRTLYLPGEVSRGLDWVICGAESGHGARPMHPDWARSLRDQCQAADVKFFFKQWGEWTTEYPSELSLASRAMTYEHGTTFYRVGKGKAGRVLDGRTWDEYPEVER